MDYSRVKKISIVIPNSYGTNSVWAGKVPCVKAIRSITGLSLRDTTNIVNSTGVKHTLNVDSGYSTYTGIEADIKTLKSHNIEVFLHYINEILEDLRKLAIRSIECGEETIANEILQFVLAEKLRRGY
jgi:hypothetical protein